MASPAPRSDRRSFLVGLSTLVGGLVAALLPGTRVAPERRAVLEAFLADLPRPGPGLERLALGTLTGATAEADRLARLILPRGDWRGGVDEVRKRVAKRVRADYRSGRTIELDGWILAETEVWMLAYRAALRSGT